MSDKQPVKRRPTLIDMLTPKPKEPPKPIIKKPLVNWKVIKEKSKGKFIPTICIVIVIASLITSIGYSYDWFIISTGDNWFRAACLSFLVVSVSLIFLQIIKIYWNRGKGKGNGKHRIVTVLVLIPLFLCAFSFNMISTIAGLYNKYAEKLALTYEERVDADQGQVVIDDNKENKDRLKEQVKRYDTTWNENKKVMEELKKDDKKYWSWYAKDQENKNILIEIAKLNDQLSILSNQKTEATVKVSKQKQRVKNFYDFIADIFHSDPNKVQLIINSLPAIIIDIVAPVIMGVVLSL